MKQIINNIEEIDFSIKIFHNIDFKDIEFYNIEFDSCEFDSCEFDSCEFDSCKFGYCKFDSCEFYSCKLDSCKFGYCKFDSYKLDSCEFDSCEFDFCGFDSCKFYSCEFPSTLFDYKRILKVSGLGSIGRQTYYFPTIDYINCGCFCGTLRDFIKKIRNKYRGKNDQYYKEYTNCVKFLFSTSRIN